MGYRDDLGAACARADAAERELEKMREARRPKPPSEAKLLPEWIRDVIFVVLAIGCLGGIFVLAVIHDEHLRERRIAKIPVVEEMARSWARDMGYVVLGAKCDVARDCALHVASLAAPIALHCGEKTCWIK